MRLPNTQRLTRILALFAAASIGAACAKPFAPPGGEQDRTPPRLMSTTPAALAVVPQFNGDIEFAFNETLAERGINDAVVTVSPQPRGKVHVRRKGDRIIVSADGGWERNQVYRVILQPGVSDRFSNARRDPVEIVFSTGPPIQNTAIAGLITDRITMRPQLDAAIEAVRRGDSATYVASGDSVGFFALRYLPAGVYDVRAFADGNHNRRRDISEAASASQQLALGATDTVPAQLVLLPADTTAPVLRRAESTDSLHVTLSFDDYIDPANGLTSSTVQIRRSADSVPAGTVVRVQLKNVQLRAARAEQLANPPRNPGDSAPPIRRRPVTRADSLFADSVRMDSLRLSQARDRAGVLNDRAGVRNAGADTVSLPDHDVVVTLAAPLPPGRYRVNAILVRNVNGFTGTGSVEFDVRAAPPKTVPKSPDPKPTAPGGAKPKAAGDTSHIPLARAR